MVLDLARAAANMVTNMLGPSAIGMIQEAVPHFLGDLALVMCVAAVTTVVFQSLRQPVGLGYRLAGVLVGPHVFLMPTADPASLLLFSELGVVLLMFTLGLEFRLSKLRVLGPTLGFITLLETGGMFLLGLCAARLMGWEWRQGLFMASLLSISSTMLVRRAATELSVPARVVEIVSGVLIFEDLVAILLLVMLTTVSSGARLDFSGAALVAGKLALFIGAVLLVGLAVVPRFVRWTIRLGRRETMLVSSLGVCFALALAASRAGYSVALGAFLGGTLIAESGHSERIEKLVQPVLDLSAAIFFVSVGMLIDPGIVARHWPVVLGLSAVVILGKIVGVSMGAFLAGNDSGTSLRSGLCMAQIGEFSFVIAGLGVAQGAVDEVLYPLAVAVSTMTAFVAPLLVRNSDRIVQRVDRGLPSRMRTFSCLYASWIDNLRSHSSRDARWALVRRAAFVMLIDASVLVGLVIAGRLVYDQLTGLLQDKVALAPVLAQTSVILVVALLCVLPFVGVVRGARSLGSVLAGMSMPEVAAGRMDAGASPRRALTAGLQFAALLIVALPVLTLAEPFLPGFTSLGILALLLLMMVSVIWRRTADLEGHLRAGAEVILEALRRNLYEETQRMDDLTELLPGLGDLTRIAIGEKSPSKGASLAKLALNSMNGITVVAITRGEQRVVLPGGNEILRAGDVLAITGAPQAVEGALERMGARAEVERVPVTDED
jgi:CPA2 family monovalent cation:H+ antiporter-2